MRVIFFSIIFVFTIGSLYSQKPIKSQNKSTVTAKKSPKTASTVKSNSKSEITISDILGSWQLVNYQYNAQAKKKKNLTQCDTLLRWNFKLDSTNNKYTINFEKTENCEDFGFVSDFQLTEGMLLIKKTKIMGFGGLSSSGSFKIVQISKTDMVLDFQKNRYYFIRTN